MATVRVTRRPRVFRDRLRADSILLDDKPVGSVRHGRSFEVVPA